MRLLLPSLPLWPATPLRPLLRLLRLLPYMNRTRSIRLSLFPFPFLQHTSLPWHTNLPYRHSLHLGKDPRPHEHHHALCSRSISVGRPTSDTALGALFHSGNHARSRIRHQFLATDAIDDPIGMVLERPNGR